MKENNQQLNNQPSSPNLTDSQPSPSNLTNSQPSPHSQQKSSKLPILISIALILTAIVIFVYKSNIFIIPQPTYTATEDSMRLPRGFDNYDSFINYVATNKLIPLSPFTNLDEPITIGELSRLLENLYNYRKMPDGFNDTVCEDEADISQIPDTSQYKGSLKFCLEHGYLTTEQASSPTETISVNHLSRIMYRITYNAFVEFPHSEEENQRILDTYNIPTDAPECRKHKVIFLARNDSLPVTNSGEFPLERTASKMDALCSLVILSDQIYTEWSGSESENRGCQPCVVEELEKEREVYEKKTMVQYHHK